VAQAFVGRVVEDEGLERQFGIDVVAFCDRPFNEVELDRLSASWFGLHLDVEMRIARVARLADFPDLLADVDDASHDDIRRGRPLLHVGDSYVLSGRDVLDENCVPPSAVVASGTSTLVDPIVECVVDDASYDLDDLAVDWREYVPPEGLSVSSGGEVVRVREFSRVRVRVVVVLGAVPGLAVVERQIHQVPRPCDAAEAHQQQSDHRCLKHSLVHAHRSFSSSVVCSDSTRKFAKPSSPRLSEVP